MTGSLRGRVARRARWARARLRPVRVRLGGGPDTVRVRRFPGRFRRYGLDTAPSWYALRGGTLRMVLPDPAALVRVAASGLLTGEVRRLEIRLAAVPDWLLAGVRPAPLARTCRSFRWRRYGRRSLAVGLVWSRPVPVPRAMSDVLAAVLRARPWDQVSGPVYALDRTAWLSGSASWPVGRLAAEAPEPELDPAGRPLGPYLPAEKPPGGLPVPVVTAVANPYGRRLVGAATRFRLIGSELLDSAGRVAQRLDARGAPEAATLSSKLPKYAVITVDSPVTTPAGALRCLAACGMVFAASDPAIRSGLEALDLVTVADPDEVDDLYGYALSVAAARRAAIRGDAALRRTTLAGDEAVPLPAVSVVLASMRSEHIETCLGYLAGQDYPALEVLVGLHGYDVPAQVRERWRELLPCPLRVLEFDTELPFGAVLGELSRAADGELLTKVDDDDHYGRQHITDLVLAWHTSGADLVGKGARFVYLPERDETLDRAWTAPEVFNVTPAGGAMLLSRGALAGAGGWSHSTKHVDADLLDRVRSAGGLVYRTHALEYVYVRRGAGHTFVTETERLLAESRRTYQGLPDQIIQPHTR